MNIAFVAILVLIALVLGGAIVAFAGWIGIIALPILLIVAIVVAVRGARTAADESVRTSGAPDAFDDPPPAQGREMGSGGGVQG